MQNCASDKVLAKIMIKCATKNTNTLKFGNKINTRRNIYTLHVVSEVEGKVRKKPMLVTRKSTSIIETGRLERSTDSRDSAEIFTP